MSWQMQVCAALRVGLAALAFCGCVGPRSQPQVAFEDTPYLRVSRIARTAYADGDLARAEALYGQLLALARAQDDAARIGDAAYNLAGVRIALDDPTPPWALLDEAEAELARARKPLADVWLVKARLAAEEKRPAEARRWAKQVLERPEAGATPVHRAAVALLRGELACDEGDDAVEARLALQEARQFLPPENAALAAGAERLSGCVLLLEGRAAEAAEAFDREVDAWRRAGRARAIPQALARASSAYAQAGDPQAAAERAYRAARSALAQGDLRMAREYLARSRRLWGPQEGTVLLARLGQLEAEIEKAVPSRSP